MNVFSIFGELKDPTTRRMKTVAYSSLSISCLIYGLVGIFGYLTFFDNVEGNILLNYDLDDPFVNIGRVAVAVVIFLSYPLMAHPCLNSIDGLLFSSRPFSWIRRIIEVVILSILSLIVAVFVVDVSLIFGLTGATASTFLGFVLPSLFILFLHPGRRFSPKKIGAGLLFACGIFFMVASTIVIIVDEVEEGQGNSTLPGV